MSCENTIGITTRSIPGDSDLDADISPSQAIDWQTETQQGTIFVLDTGHIVGEFPNARVKTQIADGAKGSDLFDVLQRVQVIEPNQG